MTANAAANSAFSLTTATTATSDVVVDASAAAAAASITGRRRRRPISITRCHGLSTAASRLQPTAPSSSPFDTIKGVGARGIKARAAQGDASATPPRRLDSTTKKSELVGALTADSSLDERISSGEFTDSGSTKERASRPVRKFLAKDPVGPGKRV